MFMFYVTAGRSKVGRWEKERLEMAEWWLVGRILYRNFFVHWRGVVTEEDGMLKEGHVRERIEQMFQRGFTRKGERREGGNEDTRVMWLPTCCLELK